MKKLLLLLFLFYCGGASANTAEDDEGFLSVNFGTDLAVEMVSLALPSHASKAIKYIPKNLTEAIVDNQQVDGHIFKITSPELAYVDPKNPSYSQSVVQQFKNNPKALHPLIGGMKGLEIILIPFFKYSCYVAIIMLFYALLSRMMNIKVLISSGNDDEESMNKETKTMLMVVVATAVWIILIYPYGGTSLLVVLAILIFFCGCFVATSVVTVTSLGLYGIDVDTSTEVDDMIRVNQEILGRSLVDTAIARITYDSHLENHVKNHHWDESTSSVNTEFLNGLGVKQKVIDDALPDNLRANIRTDCFLSRDWIRNASKPECRWLIGEANGIDAGNTRLDIDWEIPSSNPENLSASAQYISTMLTPLYEDAVSAYDDAVRASACQARYGEDPFLDQLKHSVVCAKRTPDGAIRDGEYYGYERGENTRYKALAVNSEVLSSANAIPEVKKLMDGIREVYIKLTENKVAQTIKEKEAGTASVIVRGLIDVPLKLTGYLYKLGKVHKEAINESGNEVQVLMAELNAHYQRNYSYGSKTLKQIREADYNSYLIHNYPHVLFVWSHHLAHKPALVDDSVQETLPDNPLYKLPAQFERQVNIVSALSVASKVLKMKGLGEMKVLDLMLKLQMFLALVSKFCFIFIGAFMMFNVLSQIFRLFVWTFTAPIKMVKLIFDFSKSDYKKEDDWIAMSELKVSLINTPLLMIFMILAHMVGIIACFVGISMGYSMIRTGSYFATASLSLDMIVMMALEYLAVTTIYSANTYFGLFVLPHRLYNVLADRIGDEAHLSMKKGETLSSGITTFNPLRLGKIE